MSKLTLLDGGMGRELQRIGAPFSQPLWSAEALISAPEFVTQAHQNFIDAGAEIITVNSYACVPYHLGAERYQQQGISLAQQAAELARNVADKHLQNGGNKVLVAGCLPPAFGSYRPDLFSSKEAKAICLELYQAQQASVDLFLVETIASIEELVMFAQVLQQSQQPCYYAFTLQDTLEQGQAQLRSGETVQQAARVLADLNAQAMLFNCSVPEVMAQALSDSQSVLAQCQTTVELGVYANRFSAIGKGHQANDALQSMREVTPEQYLQFSQHWHQLGASIIGGCCGIEPSHIAKLQQWQQQAGLK